MKKIMFNDKYGLTQAVLEGRKTMTRRIITAPRRKIDGKDVCGFAVYKTHEGIPYEVWLTGPDEESLCQLLPTYHIGEEVAVAQAYRDIEENKYFISQCLANLEIPSAKKYDAGWNNKMFTSSYYMPHRIRINNIKVERLQDISEEDCFKEGITMMTEGKIEIGNAYGWDIKIDALKRDSFFTPKKAFAALIDKVSGKGTWESNPWVFVYEFELLNS